MKRYGRLFQNVVLCAVVLCPPLLMMSRQVVAADPLPWPWGIECPVPAAELDGRWQLHDGQSEDWLWVRLVRAEGVPLPLLYLERRSSEDEIRSSGVTLVRAGHIHEIVAIMESAIEPGKNYRLSLKAYSPAGRSDCEEVFLVMATDNRESPHRLKRYHAPNP